jgi:hypothetical protein
VFYVLFRPDLGASLDELGVDGFRRMVTHTLLRTGQIAEIDEVAFPDDDPGHVYLRKADRWERYRLKIVESDEEE